MNHFRALIHQPEEYSGTEGTNSQIHQSITIHIHLPMDIPSKILQTRSKRFCADSLYHRKRSRYIQKTLLCKHTHATKKQLRSAIPTCLYFRSILLR